MAVTPEQLNNYVHVIDSVTQNPVREVDRLLAEDINSYLRSMILLGGRYEVDADDVQNLFQRFGITLRAGVAREPIIPAPIGGTRRTFMDLRRGIEEENGARQRRQHPALEPQTDGG